MRVAFELDFSSLFVAWALTALIIGYVSYGLCRWADQFRDGALIMLVTFLVGSALFMVAVAEAMEALIV